jgi:hypothetical protein
LEWCFYLIYPLFYLINKNCIELSYLIFPCVAMFLSNYEFEGFNGGEKGVSDVGFNRSNNKFYSLGDLSKSPGGSVYASGSGEGAGTTSSGGSRLGSFGTGTSAASAGYGGIGQQVNLSALNQTPMRRTRISSTTPVASSSVGYVPPQTTNSGTVTTIRNT